jgi:hypothetical protein
MQRDAPSIPTDCRVEIDRRISLKSRMRLKSENISFRARGDVNNEQLPLVTPHLRAKLLLGF